MQACPAPHCPNTVDSENFARIVFSRIALKDILVMRKFATKMSINDRVVLPYREGFIFTKLRTKFRENKVLTKNSEFTVYGQNVLAT